MAEAGEKGPRTRRRRRCRGWLSYARTQHRTALLPLFLSLCLHLQTPPTLPLFSSSKAFVRDFSSTLMSWAALSFDVLTFLREPSSSWSSAPPCEAPVPLHRSFDRLG